MPRSGLVEGEIKEQLGRGGHIHSVLVVCRVINEQMEHMLYLRTSWRDDFAPLRTYGDRSDRTYRDLDRLLQLLRLDFGFLGCIPLYVSGDPVLGSFGPMREEDLQPFKPPRPLD